MRLVILFCLLLLTACSSKLPEQTQEVLDAEPPPRVVDVLPSLEKVLDDAFIARSDPWEGFNRRIYYFNARFDQFVALPVVGAYRRILPSVIRLGIYNYFRNLEEVTTLINSILQLRGTKSFVTAGRLLINSTVGVLGVWDPAKLMGLTRFQEDFGQTLGRWGVKSGPYLVLPLLGPSSLRDGLALIPDTYAYYQINLFNVQTEWPVVLLRAVELRDRHEFRYFGTGSPYEYDVVRALHLQYRDNIAKE